MVIHTDSLSFKVSFITYHSSTPNKIVKENFVKKYSDDPKMNFIEDLNINEYDNLVVRFSSNKTENAKLYMSCFEFLNDENRSMETDENGFEYIVPNNEAVIHRHFHNDVGVPLIPGVYKIKAVVDGINYYSQILVKPKNLDVEEHQKMIHEIETHANGLARDWIRKKNTPDFFRGIDGMDPTYIDYAFLLVNHNSVIRNAINVISKNPYSILEKNYKLSSINKGEKIDLTSIKMNQMKNNSSLFSLRSYSDTQVYSYFYKDSYFNNVNMYLKKVVSKLIEILKKSNQDILILKSHLLSEIVILKRYSKSSNQGDRSKIMHKEKQLIKLEELEHSSKQLEKNLSGFSNNSFLVKIQKSNKKIVSQQFIKSPGYNTFHKLYNIIGNNLNDSIKDLFEYSWKSSEELYEYWCFIKIIECLIELNFKPINGWIYSNSNNNNSINIPAIPDNTSIEFIKNEVKLVFIFNSSIGTTPEKAKKENSPYWTRSNRNKPDFRIDIYTQGEFKKTIVLDSKYSPSKNIWNKNSYQDNKVVNQLKMYANMIIKVDTKNTHVVDEVIALCPTEISKDKYIEVDQNHLVTIATLKPGTKNNEFINRLNYLLN